MGPLIDTLSSLLDTDCVKLAVDLSGVVSVTSAGIRGLVVPAMLIASAGGSMLLCGAAPPIEGFLHSRVYTSLLKFRPTITEALIEFLPGREEESRFQNLDKVQTQGGRWRAKPVPEHF